jgi:DNA-binding LacI/PurR family transcriptional regulator
MQKLKYVPLSPDTDRRRRAQPMQEQRLHNIALLFPDHRLVAFSTALTARLISGVNDASRKNGAMLFISGLAGPQKLPRIVEPGESDGVIIRAPHDRDLQWMSAELKSRPVVWIFPRPSGILFGDCVTPDNAIVAALAVEYLRSKGCRRPWVINSVRDHVQYQERSRHFAMAWPGCRILECHARDWNDEWVSVVREAFSTDQGLDGIFFTDNEEGVARCLHVIGRPLNIPAICCGHFNHMVSAILPNLATVDVQPELLGAEAVDLLRWRLEHSAETLQTRVVTPQLITNIFPT